MAKPFNTYVCLALYGVVKIYAIKETRVPILSTFIVLQLRDETRRDDVKRGERQARQGKQVVQERCRFAGSTLTHGEELRKFIVHGSEFERRGGRAAKWGAAKRGKEEQILACMVCYNKLHFGLFQSQLIFK
jgi:hypothetical protein